MKAINRDKIKCFKTIIPLKAKHNRIKSLLFFLNIAAFHHVYSASSCVKNIHFKFCLCILICNIASVFFPQPMEPYMGRLCTRIKTKNKHHNLNQSFILKNVPLLKSSFFTFFFNMKISPLSSDAFHQGGVNEWTNISQSQLMEWENG